MTKFKNKSCIQCGAGYTPTGPAAKYCECCAHDNRLASREKERVKRNTGVGSGNSPTNRGITHPMYKNGIGMYKKIRNQKLFEQDTKCARCNTDIQVTNPHMWCGHHIDHDRTNNDPSNIEVVCKRCHQIEHDCASAFKKGATTISKESTPK